MSVFTKQIVCRSLFLLLGLIPLSATVGYAAWRHVTFDNGGYQQWIDGRLGLDLQMDRIVHPLPGVIRFENVRILDPESQTEIAICDQMEVTQGKSEVEFGIDIPRLDVPQDQFSRLLQLLHDRLLCQTKLLERPVSLTVRNFHLTSEQGEALLVSDMRLDAERESSRPSAEVKFRWANDPVMSVKIHRDQTASPAATHVDLQTHGSSLPCTLFCQLPANLPFSKDATFDGRVKMTSNAHGWSGTAFGSLRNVHPEAIATLRDKFGAKLKMPSPAEQQKGAVPKLKVSFEIDHTRNVLNGVSLD